MGARKATLNLLKILLLCVLKIAGALELDTIENIASFMGCVKNIVIIQISLDILLVSNNLSRLLPETYLM